MTSWIEPPPKEKKMGCLGKGCFLIIAFLILLAVAFIIGVYVGTKPKQIPEVKVSEEEQNAVHERWDEFAAASREQVMSPAAPEFSPGPDAAPPPDVGAAPSPVPTPPSPNRIELTASDINALIARGRKTRGKAFVSIDNDVGHVQVTIPLDKVGFRGRYLNGEVEVRASPDRNPRNLQITQMSLSGVPNGVLSSLMGSHSIQGYIDQYASEYGITSFTIENNKVILETTGGQ